MYINIFQIKKSMSRGTWDEINKNCKSYKPLKLPVLICNIGTVETKLAPLELSSYYLELTLPNRTKVNLQNTVFYLTPAYNLNETQTYAYILLYI